MDLTDFLRRQASSAGAQSCALFPADWVVERTGIDPAEGVRDSAGQQWGRSDLLFMARRMRRAGFRMTRAPKAGDVGMVAFGNRVCCAICTGRRWAMRLETGLALTSNGRVIAAWSV